MTSERKMVDRRIKLLGELIVLVESRTLLRFEYYDWTSLWLCESIDRLINKTNIGIHRSREILDLVFLIRHYLREYFQKDVDVFNSTKANEAYRDLLVVWQEAVDEGVS